MDFGVTLQTDPPAWRVVELPARPRLLLHLRLDLRLAHPLAGALRHLLADPLRDREYDRGSLGHQPRHPRPLRNGVDFRHPQRHVREPYYLRHRARRLGTEGPGKKTDQARRGRRSDARHQGAGRRQRDRLRRYQGPHPMGEERQAGRLDGRLRSEALNTMGRKADGFILQPADPVILEWTMRHVHDAATEAAATPMR